MYRSNSVHEDVTVWADDTHSHMNRIYLYAKHSRFYISVQIVRIISICTYTSRPQYKINKVSFSYKSTISLYQLSIVQTWISIGFGKIVVRLASLIISNKIPNISGFLCIAYLETKSTIYDFQFTPLHDLARQLKMMSQCKLSMAKELNTRPNWLCCTVVCCSSPTDRVYVAIGLTFTYQEYCENKIDAANISEKII